MDSCSSNRLCVYHINPERTALKHPLAPGHKHFTQRVTHHYAHCKSRIWWLGTCPLSEGLIPDPPVAPLEQGSAFLPGLKAEAVLAACGAVVCSNMTIYSLRTSSARSVLTYTVTNTKISLTP